jgi:hypothetical protein
MRTVGYYRYFFPGQVFALLYLPQSLWYVVRGKQFVSRVVFVSLCGLIIFQAYEANFNSWTAVHYDSERTFLLTQFFSRLPDGAELFVYQAPEVVPFAHTKHALYQFVQITPSISVGRMYESRITSGEAQLVLTPSEFFDAHANDIFTKYIASSTFDKYVILELARPL